MPILLIRHGNTEWDKRVDALLDPPLDYEGVEKIKRTGQFLKDYEFNRVVASPLQRAMKTAQMLADSKAQVFPNKLSLPWNLGDLMGKTSKSVRNEIERLHNYPDLKPPHGESYRTFYRRWTGFLESLMTYSEAHPGNLVVVTHSRNINALQSYLGGNPIGDITESTPEASVTILAKTGSDGWSYKLLWEGK